MKSPFLLTGLLGTSFVAFAQQPKISVIPPDKKPPPLVSFIDLYPGAVKEYQTSKGTVYTMPLDNMAVLMPELSNLAPMPGAGSFKKVNPGTMPNPYLQRVLPKKKAIPIPPRKEE